MRHTRLKVHAYKYRRALLIYAITTNTSYKTYADGVGLITQTYVDGAEYTD